MSSPQLPVSSREWFIIDDRRCREFMPFSERAYDTAAA
jgi:hypothetical protein